MKSNIIDIDNRGSFVVITFGNQEARDQFVAKKFLSLKKIELPIKIFPPPPKIELAKFVINRTGADFEVDEFGGPLATQCDVYDIRRGRFSSSISNGSITFMVHKEDATKVPNKIQLEVEKENMKTVVTFDIHGPKQVFVPHEEMSKLKFAPSSEWNVEIKEIEETKRPIPEKAEKPDQNCGDHMDRDQSSLELHSQKGRPEGKKKKQTKPKISADTLVSVKRERIACIHFKPSRRFTNRSFPCPPIERVTFEACNSH